MINRKLSGEFNMTFVLNPLMLLIPIKSSFLIWQIIVLIVTMLLQSIRKKDFDLVNQANKTLTTSSFQTFLKAPQKRAFIAAVIQRRNDFIVIKSFT